ncbi:hypothetical protein [Chryseolinea lacunae]|uniref:hypothetical protein n=1 Tax=Chryseolinea lacunae TaxID=2801331 RepID=UPI001F37234A|nr:hypothetical protein [Chryseolinea lacunae]
MNLTVFLTKILLALVVVCAMSCSGKKTEREQYEELHSGFTFTTYKVASRAAVGPAVTLYNSQAPDSIGPIDAEYAHLLLGYFWTISAKPTAAFAEADIAEESADNDVKFLARSLRSIAMYEQGWDSLAREESQAANLQVQRSASSNVQYEATMFYMLMGILNAYEKDFDQSKFYWAGFANQTGIHWPYTLTDAAADLHGGRVKQGLGKLKVASQDPAVPEPIRKVLGEKLQSIEEKTGDVNSSFFWPRLISAVVLDELKNSGSPQLQKFVQMVEGVKEKLPG